MYPEQFSLLWMPTQLYLKGGGKKSGTIIPVYKWHSHSKSYKTNKNTYISNRTL